MLILNDFKSQVEENNYGRNGEIQKGEGWRKLSRAIEDARRYGWKRIAQEIEQEKQAALRKRATRLTTARLRVTDAITTK
jgi:hypothetical protein